VGPLQNQGFMKVKLRKPFFLAKILQKIYEKKGSKMKRIEFCLAWFEFRLDKIRKYISELFSITYFVLSDTNITFSPTLPILIE